MPLVKFMPEEKNIEKIEKQAENVPLPEQAPALGQEKNPEQPYRLEKALEQIEVAPESQEGELGLGKSIVSSSNRQLKEEQQIKEIERILEKDMDSVYLGLSEVKKKEFKLVGEQTAKQINGLFSSGKATAQRIIFLIKRWLMVVPGINRFFLEQEAKIKSDEILNINAKQK